MRQLAPVAALAALLGASASAFAVSITYDDVTTPVRRCSYAENGFLYLAGGSSHKIGFRGRTGATGDLTAPTPTADVYTVLGGIDGDVWFTYTTTAKVGRYQPRNLFDPFDEFTIAQASYDMTVGADGAIWFIETIANVIGRLTPAGVLTEYPVTTASSYLGGITRGGDGNVWFTEYNAKKIGRITPSGTVTEYGPTANAPQALTRGIDGNVWYTAQNVIGRISPIGTITEYPIPGGGGGVAMALGPDGNVWFADQGAGALGRVTPEGVITKIPVDTHGDFLSCVCAGPDGALWFGLGAANKVGRLVPTIPGDANGDGTVDVADVFYTINFLFAGGPAPK